MYPEALILLFIGLIAGCISSAYVIRSPRREGESFGSQRKAMLALALFGACCLIAYAAIFVTTL
jgi:hypothetical protein